MCKGIRFNTSSNEIVIEKARKQTKNGERYLKQVQGLGSDIQSREQGSQINNGKQNNEQSNQQDERDGKGPRDVWPSDESCEE